MNSKFQKRAIALCTILTLSILPSTFKANADGGGLPIECGTCLFNNSLTGQSKLIGRCFLDVIIDCGPVNSCNAGSVTCQEYMCRWWDSRCEILGSVPI